MANKVKDLTGKRFGKLTVIGRCGSTDTKHKVALWLCKCDCGNVVKRTGSHLQANNNNTCGNCPKEEINLIGKKFGRWTVIRKATPVKYKEKYFCRCECGNEKEVYAYDLINGRSTSCGCYHKEILSQQSTTHGKTNDRVYNIYHNIVQRCENENNTRYKNYGGRGIKICDEWKNSFENFYNWAMANGYRDDLTIDRIDVNANYSPDNCRWVDMSVQYMNKQNTIYYTVYGVTKPLKEWSQLAESNYEKIYARYRRKTEVFREEEKKVILTNLREDNICQIVKKHVDCVPASSYQTP